MRIVSLLPSATEIVDVLGLGEHLVGISHCCDYPGQLMDRPVVTKSVVDSTQSSSATIDEVVRDHLEQSTALYALDTDLLDSLNPDLIVTQALCDVCAVNGEDVENCVASIGSAPGIVNLEPFSLADVIQTVRQIGEAAGVGKVGAARARELAARVDAVRDRSEKVARRPRVAVIDWVAPPFAAGHWMDDLIVAAGGENALPLGHAPSRTIEWSEVTAAKPDVVIIACCGFDLSRSHDEIRASGAAAELDGMKAAGIAVHVCDGNGYFSRPGPRLVDSLEMLAWILHPDVHDKPDSLAGNYAAYT